MLRCGIKTGFKCIKSCGCGNEIISFKHHCSLRTCPECSKIRKRRIRNKYLPYLKRLHQDRTNFLYFLTISPKNYENLQDGIEHLKKSFAKFLRHDYIKKRIKAGLYVIETKGTEGNWNVHLHAIVYGRFIDNKIRKNKNSKLVDLFRQSSNREVNIHVQRQGSSEFTLNYMCKYISANKDDFVSELDLAKYIVFTRKRRLISTFGEFYKVKFKINKKFICKKCGQEIEYLVDFQVVSMLEEIKNNLARPPPPPDLMDWIFKIHNLYKV
jgi:hypothetical protein